MAADLCGWQATATTKEDVMVEYALRAEAGDLVVVEGHRVGESGRKGEILEVLGTDEHPHFRVRWEDDRETLFYPSNDAHIVRGTRPK